MEFIKNFFKLEERGTKISTELVAGLTTFLAMAYILPVNVDMLTTDLTMVPDLGPWAATFMNAGGVFFATAVAAGLASILMGLLANLPVSLAPGMGLNAFFTFNLVIFGPLEWQGALAAVLVSGVLFFIISVTGLRKAVINAIPKGLKLAVGAGIGFFITFIGLKNAGIIVGNDATFVAIGTISNPTVLLGLLGIVLVVVLYSMKNKYALIISIFVTAVVGLILTAFGVAEMPQFVSEGNDLGTMFDGVKITFGGLFKGGFEQLFSTPEAFALIFTLLFVDFFDTAGTLMAVGNQAGLINDEGEIIGSDKALLVDSIGTMAGAVLGTSNVTSYIESATGIEQGARTGLSSVAVGVLFLVAIFAYPLLSVVNPVYVAEYGTFLSPVTAMALVMVGALMVGQLKDVDWSDIAIVIPAFFTIIFMVLTFSIATGIAIGFIFYPIVKLAQGKAKEVNTIMYALGILFIIFFIVGAA